MATTPPASLLEDWLVHQRTNSSRSIWPLPSSSISLIASATSESRKSAPRNSISLLNSEVEIAHEPSSSNLLKTFLAITSCCFWGFGWVDTLIRLCYISWRIKNRCGPKKRISPPRYLFNHQATHSALSRVPEPSASILSIISPSSLLIGRPISSHKLGRRSREIESFLFVFWIQVKSIVKFRKTMKLHKIVADSTYMIEWTDALSELKSQFVEGAHVIGRV